MSFKAGDWVVVRSREEILATLDAAGERDAMPFMPEMLKYCGTRVRISAVAHKTCDVACKTGGRRLEDAVHLQNVRCDGSAHGGCEAGCLIFWKTRWLAPATDVVAPAAGPRADAVRAGGTPDPLEQRLLAATFKLEAGEKAYSCQATRLVHATRLLKWWDLRQYVRDLSSGNVGFGRFLRVTTLRVLFQLRRIGIGWRACVAMHDFVHRLLTGRETPYPGGLIPVGQPTPTQSLDLTPGEWVEVRPLEEIRKTITTEGANRGMRWDPEMAQFCGRRFQVARSVDHIVDERYGKMLKMRSPCIVLDGAVCSGDYSERRLFCPRQIYPYFREVWLQRVPANQGAKAPQEPQARQFTNY